MGYLGKIMIGAVVGVGAVAAVPFTGGGSLLAGFTLVQSLAGAGIIAGVAGAAGVAAGAACQKAEDNNKEDQIKNAKESAFKDGMNEGKAATVSEIKKYVDFYLATTALSYFIALCDGNISKEEQLEIDFDLDAIKKNVDIPDAVKNEMEIITSNKNITFKDIEHYLDRVSVETLKKLSSDVDEIINATDGISNEELMARDEFVCYIEKRIANE